MMATVETALKSPSIPLFPKGKSQGCGKRAKIIVSAIRRGSPVSVPLFGKEGLGEILRNECHLEPFGALGVNSVRDFFRRKISRLHLEMTGN
jgi:hypothetical protein